MVGVGEGFFDELPCGKISTVSPDFLLKYTPLLPLPPESAWEQVAQALAGEYFPGDTFTPERLEISVPPWKLHVDIEPTSLIPTTRVSATCTQRRTFYFHLERSTQGTELATSHAIIAQSLLALPGYRDALLKERFILELRPGFLWCDTYGIVGDSQQLIRLIEIVAETLQRLRDLRIIESGLAV